MLKAALCWVLVVMMSAMMFMPASAYADADNIVPADEAAPNPNPDPNPDPDPDPNPDPNPDPEPDPGPDPNPDPEPDPEPNPDPEPDPEPNPNPNPNPEPNPNPNPNPNPEPNPEPNPSDPDDDEVLCEIDLIPYSTDATGNWLTELQRRMEGADYRLKDGIGEKGQQIRLRVNASWYPSGAMFKQGDANWRDLGGNITWTSSDPQVATVNSTGVVTATGDGEVRITATAPNSVSGSMCITVFGQAGAFVRSAEITNEAGEDYGTTYINITEISGGDIQFYLRLYYSDDTSECNAPLATDHADSFKLGSVSWSITSEEVGYVNPASGNFIPQHDGRTQVSASVTGGDPTRDSGVVYDSVFVNVNTGTIVDGNAPSDALHIVVTYEEDESLVAKDTTLTIAELRAIQTVQHTYSLTRDGGRYVTDSAEGIELATLLENQDIEIGDVAWFRFAANDGANPGAITAQFLFGWTRYYFPLVDLGVSNDAVAVPPMLAYADSWREGGSCAPDFSALNGGTCLRLLFGSTGMADNSTSKSLKYINTLTVVLSGAPPVGPGTGDGDGTGDGSGTGDGGGDENGTGGDGGGTGGDGGEGGEGTGGDGDEGGGGGGDGETNEANEDGESDANAAAGNTNTNNNNTDNSDTPLPGDTGGTEGRVLENVSGLRALNAEAPAPSSTVEKDLRDIVGPSTPKSASNGSEISPEATGGGHRWQVFEMMNKQDSKLEPLSLTNPLEPFVAPATLAVAALGSLAGGLRYRRRLMGAMMPIPLAAALPQIK
jgi:hypothetical protein